MPRLALILVPLLALAACSDPQDRDQRALAGAAIGTGAGALIGSVTGSAGRGALIGGALGTLAGALTPPPQPVTLPVEPRHGGWYHQDEPWPEAPWQDGPPPKGYPPSDK